MCHWRAKGYNEFTVELINEVKSRPLLWDRNNEDRKHKLKVAREWDAIASKLKQDASEIKSKWRNLKDTFHKEAKRVDTTNAEPGDSLLIDHYSGKWMYFESLLFLWDDNRHRFKKNNENENEHENIDGQVWGRMSSTDEVESVHGEEFKITIVNDSANSPRNSVDADPFAEENVNLKRTSNYTHQRVDKKKRYGTSDVDNIEIDEDLHFAKSLVPFMRRLTPIRKLIVRNEIHGLLLKELLCEKCQSNGPQAKCPCNYDFDHNN